MKSPDKTVILWEPEFTRGDCTCTVYDLCNLLRSMVDLAYIGHPESPWAIFGELLELVE